MKTPLLFATSGIRGKSNHVITPELGIRVGRAVANHVNTNLKTNAAVIIGFDNRRNSHSIANTIAAGLSSSGRDVLIFNAPIPTPKLIFSTIKNEAAAGIMITGSHLPADENGILLFETDGRYYKGILNEDNIQLVNWDLLGRITNIENIEDNYETFLRKIAQNNLVDNKMNILVDPAHGPIKDYLQLAIKPYCNNILKINWEDDDRLPGRPSEPTSSNLTKTRLALTSSKSDLAISTDMDGDRVIFTSHSGATISGDYIGALFAREYWKNNPNKPIVVPINTSAIIKFTAEKYNGKIIYCKVGPPSIINSILENNVDFAFEETGKYIFTEYAIWPDSVISTIKLLKLMNESGQNLDELLHEFPTFYQVKEKVPCVRNKADEVMKILITEIDKLFTENKIVNTLDGIRVDFSNNSWFIIRPSGTEDYIRIFTEHNTLESSKELNNTCQKMIFDILEKITD
ncbi:MAG: hypothetical protein OEZ01_18275 [Candidatus Heimdallarchaeota archaeon]|nr:hypothetical protein [Candidatus Heimdallarchaeota archaeon]MDH5647963.1 hypothetical protein [Candidatus Heimdallarchaeota archaeon]